MKKNSLAVREKKIPREDLKKARLTLGLTIYDLAAAIVLLIEKRPTHNVSWRSNWVKRLEDQINAVEDAGALVSLIYAIKIEQWCAVERCAYFSILGLKPKPMNNTEELVFLRSYRKLSATHAPSAAESLAFTDLIEYRNNTVKKGVR